MTRFTFSFFFFLIKAEILKNFIILKAGVVKGVDNSGSQKLLLLLNDCRQQEIPISHIHKPPKAQETNKIVLGI